MKLFFLTLLLIFNFEIFSQEVKLDTLYLNSNDKYLSVNILYPEIYYKNKKIAKLNDTIFSFIQNAKKEMENLIDDDIKEIISTSSIAEKYSLSINYNICIVKKRYISLFFESYYYTLGAHENISYKSYFFDLQNNKFIDFYEVAGIYGQDNLDEFNIKLKKYFENSDSCFTDIPRLETEKYDSYFIDNKYLYVYFLPYELGPYACGSPIIKIPFFDLKKSVLYDK